MLRPACLLPAARLAPPHGLLTPRSGTEVSLQYLGPATRRTDAYRDGTLTRWSGAASQGYPRPLGLWSFLDVTTHHAGIIGIGMPGRTVRGKDRTQTQQTPPKRGLRGAEGASARSASGPITCWRGYQPPRSQRGGSWPGLRWSCCQQLAASHPCLRCRHGSFRCPWTPNTP